MIKGGHIIDTNIIPQDRQGYKYGKGEYVFDVQTTEGRTYTPYIDFYGEFLILHDIEDLNPLEIRKENFRPACNNPERFAAMIANKDIRDATHPNIEEIEALKKFITIMMVVMVGAMAGIMYFIVMGAVSG
jgi:hypothetical protein